MSLRAWAGGSRGRLRTTLPLCFRCHCPVAECERDGASSNRYIYTYYGSVLAIDLTPLPIKLKIGAVTEGTIRSPPLVLVYIRRITARHAFYDIFSRLVRNHGPAKFKSVKAWAFRWYTIFCIH